MKWNLLSKVENGKSQVWKVGEKISQVEGTCGKEKVWYVGRTESGENAKQEGGMSGEVG